MLVSHSLGDAVTDLLLADRRLAPGGLLICDGIDNGDYPDVRAAWQLLGGYERQDRPNWGVGRKG